jgi:hypothetical protein
MPKGYEPMAETTARRPGALVFRLELRIMTANCDDRATAGDLRWAREARSAVLIEGKCRSRHEDFPGLAHGGTGIGELLEACLPQGIEFSNYRQPPGKLGAMSWRRP